MDISRILTPRRVNLNLQASSKEAAIIELTELLFSDGAISDKEAFIRDVWLREAEGSTGFENHIAIPHGKSSAVKQTTLAIGAASRISPGDAGWQQGALHHPVCRAAGRSKHDPYSPAVTGGQCAGR